MRKPSPTSFKRLLKKEAIVLPGAWNALTGLMLKDLGVRGLYVSGAGIHNARGLADTGQLSLQEMSKEAAHIIQATGLPTICDVDTGLKNIKKTIQTYERIGAVGIHVEDQKDPKRCGHLGGKVLISKTAMCQKIHKARQARRNKDFLIIARTDARTGHGLIEAIDRAQAYKEAGADMIFPESLESEQEFKAFAQALDMPLVANMTEFGKSPLISKRTLEKMGYRLIIHPLSPMRIMLGAAKKQMRTILSKGTQKGATKTMMTRNELYKLLNYKP